jgi:ABC-type multidrug transport system fused ATPase/permease subunit
MERAAAVPLVGFEEGPFFARLQRASDDIGGKLSNLLISLIDTFQVFAMGASIAATLWLVSPWLTPVLIIAAIPATIMETRVANAVQQAMLKHATGSQFLSRIESIIRDRAAGAELRLFGNGPDLLTRWHEVRKARADDVLHAEWRRSRVGIGGEAIRGFAFAVCIAIALWSITDRNLSIGTWVIVTTGIDWMSGIVRAFAFASRATREQIAYAGDLFAFDDHADALIAAEQRIRSATTPPVGLHVIPAEPQQRGMAIELREVSFAYPGGTEPVVRDVSLSIAPGESIAIVGENGAGKSTLVRLITGLYLPDEGAVLLDGVDTREDRAPNQLRRIGAVFQDYLAFQLPLRDNIHFGDVDRAPDDSALERAAHGAGLEDLLASLDDGFDTWLGRQFGDRDLSGGQWQRVALARAFYRDADLLILDEPTAALDPKAEQALFERFAALVKDRTAIMISHRLASARFADRIIVLDAGRIIEQGTHALLMERGGSYARMFAGQAEWYR